MLTSLKAVSELQNPAIRERHWQQLMKSTKVIFFNHCKNNNYFNVSMICLKNLSSFYENSEVKFRRHKSVNFNL